MFKNTIPYSTIEAARKAGLKINSEHVRLLLAEQEIRERASSCRSGSWLFSSKKEGR